MTENDAIKEIETSLELAEMCEPNREREKEIKAYKIAIQSLQKVQQFESIGTIEEFKTLKEKSVAKKPDYEGDGCYHGQIVLDTWICPNCEKHYEVDYDDYEYCPNCGQHIDHSGLTEDD